MSQHAMPFLIINLSGEMLFVLHTRLIAQQIEPAKAQQILHDVTCNTFCKAFLDELFRPQELYSPMSTRRIFTTLSDSSIMKLSENSMTKLFDLMVMAFKQQLYSMQHPREVLECTLNHLDDLYKIVPPQTYAALQDAQGRVLQLAQTLSDGEYNLIRQTLLNFALYYRVRVSLFLDNHRQLADSSFVLQPIDYLAPAMTVEAPGVIRTFQNGTVTSQIPFSHPDARKTLPPAIPRTRWVAADPTTRFSTAGHNMYLASQNAGGGDVLSQQAYELPNARGGAQGTTEREKLQAYNGEMNYLLQLVQGRKAHGTFRLDLFSDEDGSAPPPPPVSRPAAVPQAPLTAAPVALSAPAVAPPVSSAPPPVSLAPAVAPQLYHTDSSAVKAQNEKLMGIIGGLERKGNGSGGGGDDLLDIMDDI